MLTKTSSQMLTHSKYWPFPTITRSGVEIVWHGKRREVCAITTTVKKWRQYLLSQHFIIITDHRSLKEILTQTIQTPEQHIYMARLMGYDYEVHYRSDSHNQAADALSRLPETNSSLSLILSVPTLTFMEELHKQLEANS